MADLGSLAMPPALALEEHAHMAIDFSMPILVVEDFNTTAQIVSRLLTQLGFQKIDLAQGGITALAKLGERRYGLVISDWNMEPMSGLELLQQIRSVNAFASVRLIIMSAQATRDQVLAAKSGGADSFVVKPFTASTLKEKIDSLFLGDETNDIYPIDVE
jgi:two-component system, chemotaxis family, chemotaxis protein CheY